MERTPPPPAILKDTVFTNDGFEVELWPDQNADVLAYLSCAICYESFQTLTKCTSRTADKTGKRMRECKYYYCGDCYFVTKKCSQCSTLFTNDHLKDLRILSPTVLHGIWRSITVKCPEADCRGFVYTLGEIDEHMWKHRKEYEALIAKNQLEKMSINNPSPNKKSKIAEGLSTNPEIVEMPHHLALIGKDRRHHAIVKDINDHNQKKEDEQFASTSASASATQINLATPIQRHIYILSRMIIHLKLKDRASIVYKFCNIFINEDSPILNEPVTISSMLLGVIIKKGKDNYKDSANSLFSTLVTSEVLKFAQITSFEKFCSLCFPQFVETAADSPVSYMDKSLGDVIRDEGDRVGRIKFFNFMSACGIIDIAHLSEKFNLPTKVSRYETKDLDILRADIMIDMCHQCLTLNRILQEIDPAYPNRTIIERLKEEININDRAVPKNIIRNFDKNITRSQKENEMSIKLNKMFTSGKICQIGLLLFNIGSVKEHSRNFLTLYTFLSNQKTAKLKNLVLALVDANLFSGEVEKTITACHGDSVESNCVQSSSQVTAPNVQLSEDMRGKIETKLLDSENRIPRNKLLKCFSNLDAKQLDEVAYHYRLNSAEKALLAENGYRTLIFNLSLKGKTVESLLQFFKKNPEIYSDSINILESNEDIETEFLVPPKLQNILDNPAPKNINSVVCEVENFLNKKDDLAMLGLLLFKSAAANSDLYDRFHTLYYQTTKKEYPLKRIITALHDLGLERALKVFKDHYKN